MPPFSGPSTKKFPLPYVRLNAFRASIKHFELLFADKINAGKFRPSSDPEKQSYEIIGRNAIFNENIFDLFDLFS